MTTMVLFDCDGVLINTEEIGYEIMSEMLTGHGVIYSRADYIEMLSGITYDEFHKKLRNEHPELPHDFQEQLDIRMKAAMNARMKAIDGIKELLQRLRDKKIPYAVCSNSGAESLIHKLKATGLYDDFVPYIYSRHHVENAKPAPDMYLLAAKNRGVNPADCIVVEDSITGTMAGAAAGMNVIGFISGAHQDGGEAALLGAAGARMIALDPAQIWDHIADFAGLKRDFPFLGPNLQL